MKLMAVVLLSLALLAAPLAGRAQPVGKVYRVGFLTVGQTRSAPIYQALEHRLREFGYVEGQNLTIDFSSAEGRPDRLPGLAAELVSLKPDVLVTASTPSALAAKNTTMTTPIVIAGVTDPVASGIVTSMARPGANITGVSLLNVELSGKGLQLLKEAVPGLARVAVMWNSVNPGNVEILKITKAAGTALQVALEPLSVHQPEDLPSAFEDIARRRVDALVVLPDSLTLARGKAIVEFAAMRRMPAIYPFREMVQEGGLMSFGPNLNDQFRAAAAYVDKILKGAKPADLPVEQPTKFELAINLRTAKALGLTIPQSILLRADEVIQ